MPVVSPSRFRSAAAAALLLISFSSAAPAVPAKTRTPAGDSSTPAAASAKVDVNRAGVEELQTLKGIGPALARRIVEHRAEYGPFTRVEDLLAVKGIGPKVLERIRHRIAVSAAPRPE